MKRWVDQFNNKEIISGRSNLIYLNESDIWIKENHMINNFDSFHICSTIKQIFKSDRKIYFNQLKKIPHREIEDKFLFDIKKEWKEVKISSLFDFHHFKSIPKKIRKGGKIPFIGVSKNEWHKRICSSCKRI